MGKTIRKSEIDENISEAEARKQAKLKKQAIKETRNKRKEKKQYDTDSEQ